MIPKFRAWDKEEKLWIKIASLGFDEEGEMWYLSPVMDDFNPVYYENELGKTWEIMQSTGLKDKNGVEIYVGDIVILTSKSINYSDTYWHNYAEVFQQSNGAYRLRGKGMYETELYGNRKRVTLTGNIYETPELLENDRFCTETDDPDY